MTNEGDSMGLSLMDFASGVFFFHLCMKNKFLESKNSKLIPFHFDVCCEQRTHEDWVQCICLF